MTNQPQRTTDTASTAATESPFVVGGGWLGRDVAGRLAAFGESVTLVDRSPPTDPPPGQTAVEVDAFDAAGLAAANLDEATTALVLEPDDAANLLVAQLARTRFDVDRVIVRANDPDCVSAFDRPGVDVVDSTTALATAVTERW